MLRGLVALLLVANLAFFAWSQGWLSPWLIATPAGDADQREPHRLQAQVRPESITIVAAPAPEPAPVIETGPGACLRSGPYDASGIDRAEAALQRLALPDLNWSREVDADGRWWLRLSSVPPAQRAVLTGLSDAAIARAFEPCP